MKIGIFLNNYHNIIGRAYKESVTLTSAGHKVTIVARYSNGLAQEEILGGALVKRVILWPETRVPLLKQIIFSYRWIREGLKLDVDVYQVADADTLFEAAVCAILKRKKLIYDSYELFLDIASLEHAKITRAYWWVKEYLGVHASDAVIAANAERAEIMKKRYFLTTEIAVIENFPNKIIDDAETYAKNRNSMRAQLGIEDRTVFVFQGYLNAHRGLEELYDALQYYQKRDDAVFLVVGNGNYKETFEHMVREKQYAHVICTGKVDYLQLSRYLSAGDVGMVFYPPICLNYIYAAPNKLYEYMMNRLAILSNGIVTICNVIEKEKNGVYYKDSEEDSERTARNLADKIDYCIEHPQEVADMKKRGFTAAQLRYNWEYQEQKFLDIYTNL